MGGAGGVAGIDIPDEVGDADQAVQFGFRAIFPAVLADIEHFLPQLPDHLARRVECLVDGQPGHGLAAAAPFDPDFAAVQAQAEPAQFVPADLNRFGDMFGAEIPGERDVVRIAGELDRTAADPRRDPVIGRTQQQVCQPGTGRRPLRQVAAQAAEPREQRRHRRRMTEFKKEPVDRR